MDLTLPPHHGTLWLDLATFTQWEIFSNFSSFDSQLHKYDKHYLHPIILNKYTWEKYAFRYKETVIDILKGRVFQLFLLL